MRTFHRGTHAGNPGNDQGDVSCIYLSTQHNTRKVRCSSSLSHSLTYRPKYLSDLNFQAAVHVHELLLLALLAHDAMMFVRLSVRVSVCLGRACIVITRGFMTRT